MQINSYFSLSSTLFSVNPRHDLHIGNCTTISHFNVFWEFVCTRLAFAHVCNCNVLRVCLSGVWTASTVWVCVVCNSRRKWNCLFFLSFLFNSWVVAHSTRQMMSNDTRIISSAIHYTVTRRCRQWNSCFEKSIHKLLVLVLVACVWSSKNAGTRINGWMNEWIALCCTFVVLHKAHSHSHITSHTHSINGNNNK